MDSLITAAARALAAGDPLGALKRVALRDDAPALALRGIAMAQLGDFARAKALLRRAARAFGAREAVARARCVVAEAEIALASRDLGWPATALDAARATLEAHGDRVNAAHARYLEIRRLLLIGRLDEAEGALAALDPAHAAAGVAHRPRAGRRRASRCDACGRRRRARRWRCAERAARRARDSRADGGSRQRARSCCARRRRSLIAQRRRSASCCSRRSKRVLASKALVVDACRHVVRTDAHVVPLATRPVLFALARVLAEAWPGDAPRDVLVARAVRRPARRRIASGATAGRGGAAAGAAAGRSPRCGRPGSGFALMPLRARRGRRAGAPGRGRARGGARPARRRRIVVELGPGAGTRAGVSEACSGRSTRWPPPARCSRSGAAAPAAG